MSHRQNQYKARGGAFERLGVPIRGGGGAGYHRGRGGAANRFQRGGRGGRGGYQQQFGRGGRGAGRFQRGGRRPNAPSANDTVSEGFQFRQSGRVDKNWWKVVITRGADYGREALLKTLSVYLERPVWPVLYKTTDDGSATFFVDDQDVADSILAASRRVSAPGSNQKLNIRVNSNNAPYVPLDGTEEQLIKTALQHRYNALEQLLNLNAFERDPAFQSDRGLNLSLQRNNVMMSIVDLIGKEQAIADKIRCIDVSENRIRFMDYFASLVPRVPNVSKLIMHHNQIEKIEELEKLSGWNLSEIDLDQTPLCGKYRDKAAYVKDIRRIFKKLVKLDGQDLPVEHESKFGLPALEEVEVGVQPLPSSKPSFFVDDGIKNLIFQFLELYFMYFDDEDRKNRQKLLEAYDDDALFTMSVMNLTPEASAARGDTWNELTRDSHNILKKDVWERFRAKLVHKSKLAILSYLCNNFPPTTHIADTFVVDISFATGNILCVNVNGVFRERRSGVAADLETLPLRLFNRVFLLVQNERGLCIFNEMLFISALAASQYAAYRRQMERTAAVQQTSEAPVVPMADSIPGPSTVPMGDPRTEILMRFAQETGMKVDWAQKCLEDYDFDYAKAGEAFTQLKQLGRIPAEALEMSRSILNSGVSI